MNSIGNQAKESKKEITGSLVSERRGVSGTSFQLEDNRPQTIVQRQFIESLNNKPKADQTALRSTNPVSDTVQRAEWDEWKSQFGKIAPRTEMIAKLGMGIVDFLSPRVGVNLRIGGSLSAAMFGGKRKPVDIDIDVPGSAAESEAVRARFMRMSGVVLSVGTDLFKISGMTKTSAGVKLDCVFTQAQHVMDPLEEEEEIEKFFEHLHNPVRFSVDVDFSPEVIFEMSGLIPVQPQSTQGYYGPLFLLSAYVNRLASNTMSNSPDVKGDRGQITSLLSSILSAKINQASAAGQPMAAAEMAAFLNGVKKTVFQNHVKETNKRYGQMDGLFDSIIPEVVNEFYFI
jgi:hypothetical protein